MPGELADAEGQDLVDLEPGKKRREVHAPGVALLQLLRHGDELDALELEVVAEGGRHRDLDVQQELVTEQHEVFRDLIPHLDVSLFGNGLHVIDGLLDERSERNVVHAERQRFARPIDRLADKSGNETVKTVTVALNDLQHRAA